MKKGDVRYHVEWSRDLLFFIAQIEVKKKKRYDSNVMILKTIYDSSKKRDLKSHYPANVLNDKLLTEKEVLQVVFTGTYG